MEVSGKQKYAKLFLSTFELSACTYGGGFVIIPLMRKKFVEDLGWIEEQEMMDLTATRFWNINIIAIILICGTIGAIDVCFQRRARRAGNKE